MNRLIKLLRNPYVLIAMANILVFLTITGLFLVSIHKFVAPLRPGLVIKELNQLSNQTVAGLHELSLIETVEAKADPVAPPSEPAVQTENALLKDKETDVLSMNDCRTAHDMRYRQRCSNDSHHREQTLLDYRKIINRLCTLSEYNRYCSLAED